MARGKGTGPSVVVSVRVKKHALAALDELRQDKSRADFFRDLLAAEMRRRKK